MTRPPRRAGSPWRILVHEWLGAKATDGIRYGTAYHAGNDPSALPGGTDCTVLEGTEFDELVIGSWIHLEQVDAGKWWVTIGGVTVNVTADRDGRPRLVDVYGPGDYDDRREGCRYSVTWSGDENH